MTEKRIAIFQNGHDRPPIEISIDTFRQLTGFLLSHDRPQKMTLQEAADELIPLVVEASEELFKSGYIQDAARLIWAAIRLRRAADEENTPKQ